MGPPSLSGSGRHAAMEHLAEARRRGEVAAGLLESAASTIGFAHLAATQLDSGSGEMLVDSCTRWMELTRKQVSSAHEEVKEAEKNATDAGPYAAKERLAAAKLRDESASVLLEAAAETLGLVYLAATSLDEGSSQMIVDSTSKWMDLTRTLVLSIQQELKEAAKHANNHEERGEVPDVDLDGRALPGTMQATLKSAAYDSASFSEHSTEEKEATVMDEDSKTSTLPHGWSQASDPTTGLIYYYNKSTGDTSWVLPEHSGGQSATGDGDSSAFKTQYNFDEEILSSASPSAEVTSTDGIDQVGQDSNAQIDPSPSLPKGWIEITDPSTGEEYYYNVDTGESSRERPTRGQNGASRKSSRGERSIAQDEEKPQALSTSGMQRDTGILPKKADDEDAWISKNNPTIAKLTRAAEAKDSSSVSISISSSSSGRSSHPGSGSVAGSVSSATYAQMAIDARNEEIRKMEELIAAMTANIDDQEKRITKEAKQVESELEGSLHIKIDEIITQNTVGKVVQGKKEKPTTVAISESASVGQGAKRGRCRSTDLERMAKEMNESLNKADVKIKQLGDVLQAKDVNAKIQSEIYDESKSDKIKALEGMVSKLTANVEKEIRLRQAVLAGKEGIQSMFQKKMDDMSSGMNKIRSDAKRKIKAQAKELKSLEAKLQSESQEKGALTSQIALLKSGMSSAEKNAQKSIDAKNSQIKKMEEVINTMQGSIEQERKLRELAKLKKSLVRLQNDARKVVHVRNNKVKKMERVIESMEASVDAESAPGDDSSELGSVIQMKIEELSISMGAVQEEAEKAVQHKVREMDQVKTKIDLLGKGISDGQAMGHSALKQSGAVLSTMRADLDALMKLKDDAQKERDALEEDQKAKRKKRRGQNRTKRSVRSKTSSDQSVASSSQRSANSAATNRSAWSNASDRVKRLVQQFAPPQKTPEELGKDIYSPKDAHSSQTIGHVASDPLPSYAPVPNRIQVTSDPSVRSGSGSRRFSAPSIASESQPSQRSRRSTDPSADVSIQGRGLGSASPDPSGISASVNSSSIQRGRSTREEGNQSIAPSVYVQSMYTAVHTNAGQTTMPSCDSFDGSSGMGADRVPLGAQTLQSSFGDTQYSDSQTPGSLYSSSKNGSSQSLGSQYYQPESSRASWYSESQTSISENSQSMLQQSQYSSDDPHQIVPAMNGDSSAYVSSMGSRSRSITNAGALLPKVKFSWAYESLGTHSTITSRRSFHSGAGVPDSRNLQEGSTGVPGRLWASFAWIITFLIPNKCIMRPTLDSKQAWREKVALFVIMISSSVFFVGVFGFLPLVLCGEDTMYTIKDVWAQAGESWVVVHGVIYDIKDLIYRHPGGVKGITDCLGNDCSKVFPRAPPSALPQSCLDREKVDRFGLDEYSPSNNFTNPICPDLDDIDNLMGVYCHTFAAGRNGTAKYLGDYERGVLSHTWYQLNEDGLDWFALYGRVYDVTPYIRSIDDKREWASDGPEVNLDDNPEAYLFPTLNKVILNSLGMDGTKLYEELFGTPEYIDCLEEMFYHGILDDEFDQVCHVLNILMYLMLVFVALLMIIQFLASMIYVCPRHRTYTDEDVMSPVMVMMMCYNEGDNELRKGVKSVMNSTYPDENKVLVILSDGLVTGGGESMSTPEHLANILGFDMDDDDESYLYDCIGLEFKRNCARVYHGILQKGHKFLKFIVIIKCGLPGEAETTAKPGNRGKRDSQLIMMDYYNRIHHGRELCELDSAIQLAMFDLNLEADMVRFLLTIDADTRVDTMAINHMVYAMLKNDKVIALCGETKVDNKASSWVTMVQVFEYYCSHHLKKAFEAAFGCVTCLPGCFTMYRVIANDGTPLLPGDGILYEYSRNDIETLHEKNLYHLGEDRLLTTLLLKYHPDKQLTFVPEATCWTIVPHTFRILLSQRRRWINSTMHNMFELLFVNLRGVCCMSMKVVVFLDLIATMILPASYIYSLYLFFLVFFEDLPVSSVLLLLYGVIMGVQVIVFVLRSRWEYMWWFFIYFTLGLPVFYVILPTYAFWHMDDFSWGKTRAVGGSAAANEDEEDEEEGNEKVSENGSLI
ncbi:hypothetical protein ACHAWF_016096 [Thalassiosira exigua]